MTKKRLVEVLAEHKKWLDGNGGARAYLAGANLTHANLTHANLTGADLTGADLTDAYLTGADLTDAYLARANLAGANLTHAYLIDAEIPKIENLDQKILEAISGGGSLNMKEWHTCETTHCRAGWAVVVAGEAGEKLETAIGTNAAAALLYAKAHPAERVPDFYATAENAIADMTRRAAAEPK